MSGQRKAIATVVAGLVASLIAAAAAIDWTAFFVQILGG